ncbi:30S ribosomal protein S9 [Candidatus Gracilibacteria bacterium]|nr:30S ribosomal protein S9 [Candidatus Gracilibacteria bacterium]
MKKSGRYHYANGKRKSAVARVRLYKGKGEIIINNKVIGEFCSVKTDIGLIKSPLKLIGADKDFDITILVTGGGTSAQAQAARHGIAKALVEVDAANKTVLKKEGFLTRDARTKERKKFGLKRARKAPQFSKR